LKAAFFRTGTTTRTERLRKQSGVACNKTIQFERPELREPGRKENTDPEESTPKKAYRASQGKGVRTPEEKGKRGHRLSHKKESAKTRRGSDGRLNVGSAVKESPW